jgi:hypothetical protein
MPSNGSPLEEEEGEEEDDDNEGEDSFDKCN